MKNIRGDDLKDIYYRISINNWDSYNNKCKPGHKSIMVSKRFFDDIKIQSLPCGARCLYLGLMLRRGDVDTTFFTASLKDLLRFSGGSGQVIHRLMRQLEQNQLVTYEIFSLKEKKRIEENRKEENIIECESANGDEFPHRSSRAQPRGCIDEFSSDETCVNKLSNVTHRAQKSWLVAYPNADWICFEVRKAHAWCETNSHKAPKDFGKFMNNWLSRSFEEYRKGLQSKHKTFAQKNSDALQEMREKLDRGEL